MLLNKEKEELIVLSNLNYINRLSLKDDCALSLLFFFKTDKH